MKNIKHNYYSSFFYFILIFSIIIINTNQYELNNINTLDLFYSKINNNLLFKTNSSIILNPLKKILKETFYDITNDLENNITEECFNSFNDAFLSSRSEEYLNRFLKLLSINTNQLTYYEECIDGELNTSYVIIKFYEKIEDETSKMSYIFPNNGLKGFCLPSKCKNDDYNYIIKEFCKKRKEIIPIPPNFLNSSFNSYILSSEEIQNINKLELSFNYLLLIISFIIIIICLFPSIAFHISYFFIICFSCCLKSNVKKKALRKKFIGFKKCFSMSQNFNKLNEPNIKDEGLNFIVGIRGLNLFFYTIGMVFIILLHSPSKMASPQILKELFENPFYCIVFYSIKYAPIFMLASSGAMLGYKFLNFLDEKLKQENFEENKEEKKININNNRSFDSNKLIKNIKPEIDFEFINKGLLFRFISYQLDKYINFIIVLCFIRYSFYYFIDLLQKKIPTWEYFNIFLNDKILIGEMIKNFFLFPHFNFIHNNNDDYDPIYSIIFDYYWLAFNEIILFLIGIIIIYYCATKRYQILYTTYIIAGISIAFKFICYICKINKLKVNEDAPYILTYSYYGKIIINPLSNLGIYIIGVYFGIFLYVYQKEITTKKAEMQGKRFIIKISFKLIRILKSTKNNKYFIISIFSFFFIFIYTIGQLFLNYNINKIVIIIFNFFYTFDNEIIIYFTFDAIFYMVIVMNIELFSFLKSKFWRMLHKIYFSYIIICIPVILFFVYHSNTKILFNFTNVLFYSTIIIVFCFIMGLFFYLVFEMPLKNIIRVIYKKRDMKNYINNIDDIGNIRTSSSFMIND